MTRKTDAQRQADVEEDVARRAVASFGSADDLRLRQLLQSLAGHLHAFIREVRLTGDEWNTAIGFLTRTGHITDDRRQEFILLSDVLGLSMQTIAVENTVHGDATEATVFGPFFVEDAPMIQQGGDISCGMPGEPCWVEGRVTGTGGDPVPGARIDVWEVGDEGMYDVQYPGMRTGGRAFLYSDADGRYRFWGLTPTAYPIPDDGPVGDLLRAANRSPYRAPHLHFMVTAPGYRRLVTHIFVRGGDFLDSDSVFGVKESLIRDFDRQPAGTPAPDGRGLGGATWTRTVFDIVLAPQAAASAAQKENP